MVKIAGCEKMCIGGSGHLRHAGRQYADKERHGGAHVTEPKTSMRSEGEEAAVLRSKDGTEAWLQTGRRCGVGGGGAGGGGTHAVIEGGRIGMKMCSHLRGKRSWRRPNTQEERRLGEVEVTMTRRSMSRPGEWSEQLHGGCGGGGDARYLRQQQHCHLV